MWKYLGEGTISGNPIRATGPQLCASVFPEHRKKYLKTIL